MPQLGSGNRAGRSYGSHRRSGAFYKSSASPTSGNLGRTSGSTPGVKPAVAQVAIPRDIRNYQSRSREHG
jgi:hypothetical protein